MILFFLVVCVSPEIKNCIRYHNMEDSTDKRRWDVTICLSGFDWTYFYTLLPCYQNIVFGIPVFRSPQ